MRNTFLGLIVFVLLVVIVGCTVFAGADNTSLNTKVYTHEDLIALSEEQLLNLFVENGLEINDELRSLFTEEELQTYFKDEFENLCQGITARNATMYFDLAKQTEVIYERITCSN